MIFPDSEIEFARLYMWADQLVTIPVLSRRLKEAIDEDGRVTDDASPELKSIKDRTFGEVNKLFVNS